MIGERSFTIDVYPLWSEATTMRNSIRYALATAVLTAAMLGVSMAQTIIPIGDGATKQVPVWVRIAGVARILSPAFETIAPLSRRDEAITENVIVMPGAQLFPITLPFKFKFLGERYDIVYVGITGAMKFKHAGEAPPNTNLGSYDLHETTNHDEQQLLMPFWGNFMSTGTNDEGIYTKYYDAGTPSDASDDVFIIEWNVEEVGNTAGQIFRFQCRLRRDNVIDFIYDSTGAPSLHLPVSVSEQAGAVVGIKNIGEAEPGAGANASPFPDQPDWPKTMLLANPDQFMPFDDPVYITGLPVVNIGTSLTPVWYSGYGFYPPSSAASPYFHYGFPSSGTTTGYRIMPVEQDIGPDTGPLGIVRACNTYRSGEPIIVSARFINFGDTTASNIPVMATLSSIDSAGAPAVPRDTITGTIGSIPGDSSVAFTFANTFNIQALAPGSYRLCVISNYGPDQDSTNDMVCTMIYIRAVRDAKALCILEPKLVVGGPYARYPLSDTLRVSGCFCNAGLQRIDHDTVGYVIYDTSGNALHGDSEIIDYFEAGDDRSVIFNGWLPETAGMYYIHLGTHVWDDQNQENDSLRSFPRSTGTTHFHGSLPRIPFLVLPAIDLAVGDPDRYGRSPSAATVPPGKQLIAATLLNEGARDQRNVAMYVKIEPPGGPTRLDTMIITDIPAGARRLVYDTSYDAPARGTYTVTAWVQYPGDANPTNDTATWQFTVQTIADVRSHEPATNGNDELTVQPNPASNDVVVRCTASHAEAAHVYIDDIYGSTVRARTLEAGAARINTATLPSGVYIVRLETAAGLRIIRKLIIQH